jgi:hypothetical protein
MLPGLIENRGTMTTDMQGVNFTANEKFAFSCDYAFPIFIRQRESRSTLWVDVLTHGK